MSSTFSVHSFVLVFCSAITVLATTIISVHLCQYIYILFLSNRAFLIYCYMIMIDKYAIRFK